MEDKGILSFSINDWRLYMFKYFVQNFLRECFYLALVQLKEFILSFFSICKFVNIKFLNPAVSHCIQNWLTELSWLDRLKSVWLSGDSGRQTSPQMSSLVSFVSQVCLMETSQLLIFWNLLTFLHNRSVFYLLENIWLSCLTFETVAELIQKFSWLQLFLHFTVCKI